jgi:hypothetical protein
VYNNSLLLAHECCKQLPAPCVVSGIVLSNHQLGDVVFGYLHYVPVLGAKQFQQL